MAQGTIDSAQANLVGAGMIGRLDIENSIANATQRFTSSLAIWSLMATARVK